MTEQHLDLDALADALAGSSDPHLGAHLAGCAQCTAALRALESALVPVGASLASLTDPELPEDVAARLDRVLAAAARPGARAAGADVTPLAPRTRRTWMVGASGLAAAAVLLLGLVALRTDRTDGTAADASRAETTTQARIATSSSGNDYGRDGALLKQALPALLGARGTTKDTVAAPEAAGVASALAPLHDPAVLAACLAGLSDPEDEGIPLALDYASFEGKPALVVVLPSSRTDKVDVFVVGAGCSQADAQLLLFSRLPRSR